MPALSQYGYCVAVDFRGYGRTTGWNENELREFTIMNIVRDMVILVHALGYQRVKCVIGHDFGALVSSFCALIRPDIFESVIMMSHPFKTLSSLPFDTSGYGTRQGDSTSPPPGQSPIDIQADLATLENPRKHYKFYNSTPHASGEWMDPPQGMRKFLRGYFHLKSAAWKGNGQPYPLQEWSASELAKLPEYYVMPLSSSMPDVVLANMAGEDENATKPWLPDADLDIYVQEWTRTGFQGGLNWYRNQTHPDLKRELDVFASRQIEVPAIFISGEKDWGNFQEPGAIESLPETCRRFHGVRMISNAGHWPQQEQPNQVVDEILAFLKSID